jgi:hypothetical protein
VPRRNYADDFGDDPALMLANPDDEVTPESFLAWLDRVQQGDPVDPGCSGGEHARRDP